MNARRSSTSRSGSSIAGKWPPPACSAQNAVRWSGSSSRLPLLQGRRDWTGPELARRLGVTAPTVRTDVERLRTLGYPVHATPGAAGGYRLGAGAALPPLLLDDEEAVAVAIGLRRLGERFRWPSRGM
jgi:biotin operon repressor